ARGGVPESAPQRTEAIQYEIDGPVTAVSKRRRCCALRHDNSRPLARRSRRRPPSRRRRFLILGEAAAQRLHEIDHPPRRGKRWLARWNGTGLLGPEVREQRLLVAVPERQGVEIAGLAVHNMLSQREHLPRHGQLRSIAEARPGL